MATNDPKNRLTPEQELARRSRRSFLAMGAGAAGVTAGWYWLNSRPLADEIPWPLRRVLDFNQSVVRNTLYSDEHLVRTFPASAIGRLKVNGDIGMEQPIDQAAWRLDLAPTGGPQ